MSRCPSCGGIINRDCFNPVECGQITQNLNYKDNSENAFFYKNEIDGLNLDIAELLYENARLREEIKFTFDSKEAECESLRKTLREIMEFQMNNVQLAESTMPYRLAKNSLKNDK